MNWLWFSIRWTRENCTIGVPELSTYWRPSRTSGLGREQRGPGRLKLAEVAHVTRVSDTTFKVKRSKVKVTGVGAHCEGSRTACLGPILTGLNRHRSPIKVIYCRQIGVADYKYMVLDDPYHPVTWHGACALPILPLKWPTAITFINYSATGQARSIKPSTK